MIFDVLTAQWQAPSHVRAISTLRQGGVSEGCYSSLNLGAHVADDRACVERNRQRLQKRLGLVSSPVWLEQVHGCRVVELNDDTPLPGARADASFTSMPGVVCAVLTADCLPVVFCNRVGTKVAVAHAGWRGLAAGILESTIARLEEKPADILVWLGPAIGPDAFEVGEDVVDAFVDCLPVAEKAFRPVGVGKWYGDIYRLARQRLKHLGIVSVTGGGHCTYTESAKFFSYRRTGVTGRMATLVWIEKS